MYVPSRTVGCVSLSVCEKMPTLLGREGQGYRKLTDGTSQAISASPAKNERFLIRAHDRTVCEFSTKFAFVKTAGGGGRRGEFCNQCKQIFALDAIKCMYYCTHVLYCKEVDLRELTLQLEMGAEETEAEPLP